MCTTQVPSVTTLYVTATKRQDNYKVYTVLVIDELNAQIIVL